MAITTICQTLIPIRRDGQVAVIGSISTSGGGGSSSGGGTSFTGGTNICLGTGTTVSINVCGTVASANNSSCLGGYPASCYINCQSNCLCVAHAGTADSATVAGTATYATSAGSVPNALMASQSGSYNNYLIKFCSNTAGTWSRILDDGSAAVSISGQAIVLNNDSRLSDARPANGGTATTALNSNCLGGFCYTCYINCPANCLCVAYAGSSGTAAYATTAGSAGSVTGGITGAQDGSSNNYLTKYCANAVLTGSRYFDNGTCACIGTCLCACCFIGNVTGTASNSLGLCGCTPACFLGATATATCATTAGNALCLGGCLAACYPRCDSASNYFISTQNITIGGHNNTNAQYVGNWFPAGMWGMGTCDATALVYLSGVADCTGLWAGGTTGTFKVNGIICASTCFAGSGACFAGCIVDNNMTKVCINMTNGAACFAGWLCATGGFCSTAMIYTQSCVCAADFIGTSDIRYKTNIQPICTKPINIEYNSFELCNSTGNTQYGVIAQKLQQVAPELVTTDENGMLGVRYTSLFAYEINALKCEIKALRKEIHNMRYENNSR